MATIGMCSKRGVGVERLDGRGWNSEKQVGIPGKNTEVLLMPSHNELTSQVSSKSDNEKVFNYNLMRNYVVVSWFNL